MIWTRMDLICRALQGDGTTEGAEVAANLKITNRWTLNSGYTFLEMQLHTEPASQDATSVADYQGSNPQHQAQLRSHVELSHGLSWDANTYFVSALLFQLVASHTGIDSQLSWKLGREENSAWWDRTCFATITSNPSMLSRS
jgi:outer membrane receptor for monomeric catechols